MNPPKLIFVNRYFHPDHSATSQMLSDLAFALAERGEFAVHVVTSRQRYGDAAADLPAKETVRGVTVHRVWTSRFGRRNLRGRAMDYASFYCSAAGVLWKLADRRSIVVAKTDPPLISVLASGIAKLKGARFVNWIQDLFPEVAESLGITAVKGLAGRLVRGSRNRSLQLADTNVAIGDAMGDRLLREGISGHRIRVIHNWADEAGILPVEPAANALRKDWGLDGQFVVGYSGNLGRGHDFGTLLEAAEALRNRPGIRFLIIGGGAQLAAVRAAVAERQLDHRFVFRPYQPRETLSASLSAADAHLVSLRPELEGLIVPSKFYGIAAAGRPVLFIGSRRGEIARMIAAAGCGFTVAEGDAAALRDRILELAGDPRLCRSLGEAARRALESRYGFRSALDAWRDVLKGLRPVAGAPLPEEAGLASRPRDERSPLTTDN